MSDYEIQICMECKHPSKLKRMRGETGGIKLLETVSRNICSSDLQGFFKIRAVACLGSCSNRCRLTVVGTRRWTWSLGSLHPTKEIEELMEFLHSWLAVGTGLVPKAKRSKWLLKKALGRNPPQHGLD